MEPKYKEGDWLEIFQLSTGDTGKIGHKFQVDRLVGKYYYPTKATSAVGGCWLEQDVRLVGSPGEGPQSSDYPIF